MRKPQKAENTLDLARLLFRLPLLDPINKCAAVVLFTWAHLESGPWRAACPQTNLDCVVDVVGLRGTQS